jgi:hypothetical protein
MEGAVPSLSSSGRREWRIDCRMFVFMIGNGRSGSTLLHETLARHPGIGFISNIEDRVPGLPPGAGRFNNALYRRVPQTLTRKGRLRYAPSEGWRLLAREVSPMLLSSSRDLLASDAMPWVAERFRSSFEQRAHAQSRPVFLHKFTGWPRSGFIRAVFPDARFVNVVRDGRAVVASDLRVSWWRGWLGPEHLGCGRLPPAYEAEWEASGQSFALLAGLSWKIAMDAYAAAREFVPQGQWLDVRYEDVVADPKLCFKEMLDFMGLEGHPTFDAALMRTVFRTDRREGFRRHLDPASLELLEASLADHLRFWGYS